MIRLILLTLPLALAACGADGPPVAPSQAPGTGVTVSGEVSMGLGGSL